MLTLRACGVSCVALMLALAGCSASDGGGSKGGQGNNGNGSNGNAGTGGTSSGSGGDGSFGNGNGNTGGTVGGTIDGGMCMSGMRCGPVNPDDGCGSLPLKNNVKMVPGNVLVIFDRSLSMNDKWDNSSNQSKWQAAGTAMIQALTPVQDLLTIGAIFYPDTSGASTFVPSCTVQPITDQDQINFLPGAMALTKMQAAAPSGTPTPLYAAIYGSTPTLDGLKQADAALAGATLMGTTIVILVTDGDPTCTWDLQMALDLVTKWFGMGIKTYALGVPGVGSNGAMLLDQIAMAGGTGMYIPPTDAMSLQQKIHDIVLQAVGIDSCHITVNPAAEAPDKVHLIVNANGMDAEVPQTFSSGEKAWTISADGATIDLLGNTCDAAKSGQYAMIHFEFGCVDVPPAMPPIPL